MGAEPKEITKRRNFLKKLSVQDRNLLLTGDPFFEFDPLVYSCCFFSPRETLPAILQHNFDYIIPDNIVVNDVVPDEVGDTGPTTDGANASNPVDDEPGFMTADSDSDQDQSPTLTDTDAEESSGPSGTKIFKADSTYESSTTSSSSTNSEKFDPSWKPSSSKCIPPNPLPPRATRSGQPSGPSAPPTSQQSSGATSSFFADAFSRVGNVVSRLVDSHPLANLPGPSSATTPQPTPTSSAGSRRGARTTSMATRKRPKKG